MRYRIVWDPDAFQKLVSQWSAAGQPANTIKAFEEIEMSLAQDAHLKGESRKGHRRILISMPIGVIFRAFPDTNEVLVLDAWMIHPKFR